jgi:hypothetical protein
MPDMHLGTAEKTPGVAEETIQISSEMWSLWVHVSSGLRAATRNEMTIPIGTASRVL